MRRDWRAKDKFVFHFKGNEKIQRDAIMHLKLWRDYSGCHLEMYLRTWKSNVETFHWLNLGEGKITGMKILGQLGKFEYGLYTRLQYSIGVQFWKYDNCIVVI